MKKPIIHYQFDYDEFRKSHYNKGYFGYLDNGFGEVLNSEKELLIELKENFKNDFITKDVFYSNRVFF